MNTETTAPERLPANNCKRYFAHVNVDTIDSFPYNYRQDFDQASLKELAASIEQQGLIEPVIVHGSDHPVFKYTGIAGERRWRAARLAGLEEIPAIVYDNLSQDAALEIALVENLQRQDVNAMEEAAGYAMLRDKCGLKQQEIADKIGRPRSSVANTLRLLDLPDAVRQAIAEGKLTKAHGTALLRFRGYPEVIEKIAGLAIEEASPAGDLETGLPFSYELRDAGLAYQFGRWELSEEWYPARMPVLKKAVEDDKNKGWIKSDGHFYTLDPERGVEVKKLMLEAEDKYERDHRDDDDEKENADPEAKARADLEKAVQRMNAWKQLHDDPKKGPTRGSPLIQWENPIKAFLYLFEDWLTDIFMDLDEDLWNDLFDVPQDQEEIDTDRLRAMIFKLPVHAIIETMLEVERRDAKKDLDNGGNYVWSSIRFVAVARLLSGEELEEEGAS